MLVSSACAVKSFVWMGVCVCGCPSSLSVHLKATAVLAPMNSAPSLALVADDITVLIICKMLRTALLLVGMASVPARNMWPPAQLRAFSLDKYDVLLWIVCSILHHQDTNS